MSHGRVHYQCGCVQSQCRCNDRGGHVISWLDYACPRHPGVVAPMNYGARYAWEFLSIETDRERLLAEFID